MNWPQISLCGFSRGADLPTRRKLLEFRGQAPDLSNSGNGSASASGNGVAKPRWPICGALATKSCRQRKSLLASERGTREGKSAGTRREASRRTKRCQSAK